MKAVEEMKKLIEHQICGKPTTNRKVFSSLCDYFLKVPSHYKVKEEEEAVATL